MKPAYQKYCASKKDKLIILTGKYAVILQQSSIKQGEAFRADQAKDSEERRVKVCNRFDAIAITGEQFVVAILFRKQDLHKIEF